MTAPRLLRRAAAAVLAAATVLAMAGCGGDDEIPYDDPESAGRLALYDAGGRPVTSGSVNDKPFVSYAISDQKAPPGYEKPGRRATLMAYQPRQGVDPARWGGDFLTGSTPYPDPGRPTAHGTAEDITLANFIAVFPPQWEGLIQLRMYLGAPEQPGKTDDYATADIKVDGDKWTLVRGAAEIPGGVASTEPGPQGSPR